jgi:NitT/TauT family transport system substrate-binding protein
MRSTNRKFRGASILAPLAAFALVLAACGGDDAAEEPAPADPGAETEEPDEPEEPTEEPASTAEPADVTFMLPSDNPVQYYPLFVAQELGYFADENLTVTIEDVGGSSAVIQQVIAGNADIGMPSPPAYLNAASRDQDIYFFYQMHYTNVFDLIAPDDGEITSPEDLQGRSIGVSELAGGEVPFVRAIMGGAGLSEGTDYEIVAIGEGGALTFNALDTNQVDAYASSIYDIASLNAAGLTTTSIMPEEFKNYPANGFVVTGDVLESQEDVLVRFLRAVNKATVFGRENPDAALEIATQGRSDLYDDPEIVEAFWNATLGMMTPPDAVADEAIGSMYRDGWQGFHDFMAAQPEEDGGLPQEVDLDQKLVYDLVEQAMDFDIEAIRAEAQAYTS